MYTRIITTYQIIIGGPTGYKPEPAGYSLWRGPDQYDMDAAIDHAREIKQQARGAYDGIKFEVMVSVETRVCVDITVLITK